MPAATAARKGPYYPTTRTFSLSQARSPSFHLVLFLVTVVTTTIAGAEWMFGRYLFVGDALGFAEILSGLKFSVPFLLVLTIHEFGHYCTARFHQVKVSLPYYIPMWLGFLGPVPTLGTFGAVIRIRQRIRSRIHYFDIGASGPIAGFLAVLPIMFYGFTHLPDANFIFSIHPEYKEFGFRFAEYVYQDGMTLEFGGNLAYWIFQKAFADPLKVPHVFEAMHYPLLLSSYLCLFFTALNLLPLGQLDGGHIVYGLFGRKISRLVNVISFSALLVYAGMGFLSVQDLMIWYNRHPTLMFLVPGAYLLFLYTFTSQLPWRPMDRWIYAVLVFLAQFSLHYFFRWEGYHAWLVLMFLIGRFMGVYHPGAPIDGQIGAGRRIVGWVSIVIFILCFSPRPFIIS